MSEPIINELPQEKVLETKPLPTLDQVADAIRADAAKSPEYLEDSVVPFGGE